VGVEDAGLETKRLQAKRQVDRGGRLADATLAGGNRDQMPDAGDLGDGAGGSASRRGRRLRGTRPRRGDARTLGQLARPAAGGCGGGAAARRGSPPAVSTAVTLLTPAVSATIFSAAWRNGSSSWARAAGTVMEKETRPSLIKTSETRPRSTMLLSRSGPLTRRRRARISSRLTLMPHSFVSPPAPPPCQCRTSHANPSAPTGRHAHHHGPQTHRTLSLRGLKATSSARHRGAHSAALKRQWPAPHLRPAMVNRQLPRPVPGRWRHAWSAARALERLLALLDHHVGVVGIVRQLQPQILIAAEATDRIPDLLEVLVLSADGGIDLVGGLEA